MGIDVSRASTSCVSKSFGNYVSGIGLAMVGAFFRGGAKRSNSLHAGRQYGRHLWDGTRPRWCRFHVKIQFM